MFQQETVAGACKNANELSDSRKGGKFLSS